MTKKLELYKCKVCGNFVEVVLPGAGELVCCGQFMTLIEPMLEETISEKHLPFFDKKDDELFVRIGSIPHPMEQEHYIQFIEVYSKDEKYLKRKYFEPKEEPVLKLKCLDMGSLKAREFCNIHGLWEADYD